ncbi:alanine--tRNA ligase [Erysipelothrix urinaevulpis]|uniref:alanine--tRNA ligase n=1 Tax=Erysipelothrix urinaevulpis TaxID=2683717 RepID=UPI001356BF3B|nr:alanine--tRNA ligase [Erysipelothrix urinaevulpis]
MKTSLEVRQMFLDFFESKKHKIEPGAGLIPQDDETLLWINSGVAALKKYFDGSVKPTNPRIVNIQKSIRTNDIENVGKTSRHHTFFEMMGNFSIGDYFKEEAIDFAYEFLFSKEYIGFDVKDAYFSVHPDDTTAYSIWHDKYHIPADRILKTEDNFWQIGDGPCGPNTEIFIDRGPKYDPEQIGEKLFFEDLENDRYVEIWNIVFSQFDGKEGQDIHTFKELPQKNIDTGMGFERLMSIVQNVETNFDTDLFMPIINEIESKTEITYQQEPMAYRVIADHIRTLVFALSDGAVFSNEGRGYVLRRVLRRGVRFGRNLNIKESFMYELVDVVIATMDNVYPNLHDKKTMVKSLIEAEEIRFSKTLDSGERLLMSAIEKAEHHLIDGKTAFTLYDTYGFPIELSQEIAAEKGVDIDLIGFNEEMEIQRERARNARQTHESMGSQNEALMNFNESSEFVYTENSLESSVIALIKDGTLVDVLEGEGLVITRQTPFYAESGGQVSDKGTIENDSMHADVIAMFKGPHGQHVHHVKVEGQLKMNESVSLTIDEQARRLIRKNHSAVHLLQSILRTKLGSHVEQAGSFVTDEYFRFDFSHFESVEKDMLDEIEYELNEWISVPTEVETIMTDLNTAQEMGALAFFSDNYGDQVRLVKMGDKSMELCGGTHVGDLAEIGCLKIIKEESVGSGVRRITGTTSLHAYEIFKESEQTISTLREEYKIPEQKTLEDRFLELEDEVKNLQKKNKQLSQEALKYEMIQYQKDTLHNDDGLSVLYIEKELQDMKDLKEMTDSLVQSVDIIGIINLKEESLNIMVRLSKEAIAKGFKAGEIAKSLAVLTGGNGGGRPDFAQAGGKDLSKVAEAKALFMDKTKVSL